MLWCDSFDLAPPPPPPPPPPPLLFHPLQGTRSTELTRTRPTNTILVYVSMLILTVSPAVPSDRQTPPAIPLTASASAEPHRLRSREVSRFTAVELLKSCPLLNIGLCMSFQFSTTCVFFAAATLANAYTLFLLAFIQTMSVFHSSWCERRLFVSLSTSLLPVADGTWIELTYGGGDLYHSHCESGSRTARIVFLCDPNVKGQVILTSPISPSFIPLHTVEPF